MTMPVARIEIRSVGLMQLILVECADCSEIESDYAHRRRSRNLDHFDIAK